MLSNILLFLESAEEESAREPIPLKPFLETEVLPLLKVPDPVRVVLDLPDALTMTINPLDLQRVFLNLFSNALRFTAEGNITVASEDENLSFSDTGSGIRPGDEERVFEPFYTSDPSRDHRQGGMGLGLVIVRNLLERHGYTIRVDSTCRSGAKFLISTASHNFSLEYSL